MILLKPRRRQRNLGKWRRWTWQRWQPLWIADWCIQYGHCHNIFNTFNDWETGNFITLFYFHTVAYRKGECPRAPTSSLYGGRHPIQKLYRETTMDRVLHASWPWTNTSLCTSRFTYHIQSKYHSYAGKMGNICRYGAAVVDWLTERRKPISGRFYRQDSRSIVVGQLDRLRQLS